MANELADLEAWLAEIDVPAKVDGMTAAEVASGLSASLGRKCSTTFARGVIHRLISAGLWEHAGERPGRRTDGRRCWHPVYRPIAQSKGRGAK